MIPSVAMIEEPYRGTWVAEITTTEQPNGSFDLGQVTWLGALTASGAVADGAQWHTRVVGGRGKLATVLPYKNYATGIQSAQVFIDIITGSGETPGAIVAPGRLPYYEREKTTAGMALNDLADQLGLTWWVSRSGLVCVGAARSDTGAVDPVKAPQTRSDADSVTLSVLNAADVAPGKSTAGRTIMAVRWHMQSKLTAECAFTQAADIDFRGSGFYQKTYQAKVDRQNANKSVNVIVDGKFQLDNVPLLPGIAGAVPLMRPGDLVSVGFLGWNRATPYAVPAQLGSDSAKPAALQGDSVEIILPPFAFVGTINGVEATGVMTALTGETLGTISGPCSQRLKLD